MITKRILIAGCGDLGTGIAPALVEQGHQVSAIRRTGLYFPSGVHGITGDLTQFSDEQFPDVDLIFLIMTPQEYNESAYRTAYYETATRIVERYRATQPRVFFVSSTSVYGQNQGDWIDEHTEPQRPDSASSRWILEAEQVLAKALPSVAVRCSGIYGPGRYRLLQKVMSAESWDKNSWTNRVHRDDVVRALLHLANCAFQGETLLAHYEVTDHTPVSMWEVKLCIAHLLGVPANIPDNAQAFLPKTGKRISNKSLVDTGFRFQYPSYVSGYLPLVEQYRHERSV